MVALQHQRQHLHDALGDACLGCMSGGYLYGVNEFEGIVVDEGCVGKGAAHVYANSNFHALFLPRWCLIFSVEATILSMGPDIYSQTSVASGV